MDFKKLPFTNVPPVQLWISDDTNQDCQKQYLKRFFCAEKTGCDRCYGCNAVNQNQHPCVMRMSPPYTLESINPIKEQTSFLLESDERYFFIFTHAEKLLVGTANALLKILEEPPKGYHFILQTNHQEAILPTILSRSVLFHLQSEKSRTVENKFQPLFDHFSNIKPLSADAFLTLIDSLEINEQESATILTMLLSKEKVDATEHNNHRISILMQHLAMIDSTTNTKFLWKNLFLETFEFEK
jgi:hypothetical protein